ncbi:MAG: YceI family protein [Bacteroidetes bacterium]|nr:YceI family protein [Bacteroidota bacterium]
MKKTLIAFTVLSSVIFTTAFAVYEQANRSIDKDYTLKFSTSLASGTFYGLEGKVYFSPSEYTKSKIDISVDASTINTGNSLKDTHAKSQDWLNVASFPFVKFASTEITKENSSYIINWLFRNMRCKKTDEDTCQLYGNKWQRNIQGRF